MLRINQGPSLLILVILVIVLFVSIGEIIFQSIGSSPSLPGLAQKEDEREKERQEFLNKIEEKIRLSQSTGDLERVSQLRELREKIKNYEVFIGENFLVFIKPPKTKEEMRQKKALVEDTLFLAEVGLIDCLDDLRCSSKPTSKIAIVILDNQKDFNRIIGAEKPSAFRSDVDAIVLTLGGVTISNLAHEIAHFGWHQKARELGVEVSHYGLEEGFAVSREEDRNKRERILNSLLIHNLYRLERVDSDFSKFVLRSNNPPFNYPIGHFYSQAGSLIMFLLDQGITEEEIILLAKELMGIKTDSDRESILRNFFKKHGLDYQKLEEQWIKWEQRQSNLMRKRSSTQQEINEFRKKILEGLAKEREAARKAGRLKQLEPLFKEREKALDQIAPR